MYQLNIGERKSMLTGEKIIPMKLESSNKNLAVIFSTVQGEHKPSFEQILSDMTHVICQTLIQFI